MVNGGGQSSYNNFIVDDIKRVEIVRGPGSALYGANAFIAVINIITKDASDINGVELSVGAGSYEAKKANLLIGDEFGGLALATNFNVFDTDGFEGDVESDAIGASGKSDYWERRYDFGFQLGYGNYSMQGKYLKRQSGPYLSANNVLNDDSQQEYIEYFLEIGHLLALSSQLELSTQLYFDHFQFDNLWEIFPEGYTDPSGTTYPDGLLLRSPAENEKAGVEVQFDYRLNQQHKLLAGLMYEHQRQYNVELWSNGGTGSLQNISDMANWNDDQKRDVSAVFIQDIWDMHEDVRVIAGARYDDYSDFGGSFNPRLSLTWEVTENYSLITTYGSAFRAPTFGELYNKNNPSVIGNPNVQPEEIETFELGLNGDITKRTNFRVTGFRSDITNLIAPTPSDTAVNVSSNVGKLTVNGVELEFASRFRDGSGVALNYTYQHPVNELTNERAPDVPLHKANASFNYRHSKHLDGFIGLLYRGRLSRAEGDVRADVPDFVTLDFAVTWKNYIENLEVQASVYNLTDKQYFDPSPSGVMLSDYPKPGRNLMVELSYKI